MIKDTLRDLQVEDIHKRIVNTKFHSLRDQAVNDIQKIRKLDISFTNALLKDLEKPAIHNSDMLHFYTGMMCILNLLLEKETNETPV